MIAKLTGTISDILSESVILEVNGVGYRVEGDVAGLLPGTQVTYYVHTHVREQELRLFGFKALADLEIFEKLLSVSGIGPKVALGLIKNTGRFGIIRAILQKDSEVLIGPGVGKKIKERIVLELANKIDKVVSADDNLDEFSGNERIAEVEQALLALDYDKKQIKDTLAKIKVDPSARIEDIIKTALQLLQHK